MSENSFEKGSRKINRAIKVGLIAYLSLAAFVGVSKETSKKRIEEGHVEPRKAKIIQEDLNNNGKLETLLKYDGKSYMLMLNEQGRPVIRNYELEVKPEEITIKIDYSKK
ncbi:hypothetical protein KY348_00875 [Candidatus Woesearchaeota archaeon]|nr:hypothetical protein [Candidatus Woesearchaeota archaeon]